MANQTGENEPQHSYPGRPRGREAGPAGERVEVLLEREGEFKIDPETVERITTVTFTTPPGPELGSYTLTMEWKEEAGLKESNWAHILVVPRDWSPGPGMHLIH